MESINPVLKSLTPKSRVEKDNDVYSTVIEPSSSFSSTWSSLLGVNYGSMSVELENRIRTSSEGMANPSGANFNALASQDEEVQSIMNQYNFDNGDSMSDYWHQNFFAFFNLHFPLLKRARIELGLEVANA